MNNIKKLIFKTQTDNETPPSYYDWAVSEGTQICSEGYVDIGGTIANITVYSSIFKDDWVEGTILYDDIAMTIPTTATFLRSITGGTIGLLYISLIGGAITTIIPPMTGC